MIDEQEIVAKRTKGTIWSDRKEAAALLLLRRLVIVGPQNVWRRFLLSSNALVQLQAHYHHRGEAASAAMGSPL